MTDEEIQWGMEEVEEMARLSKERRAAGVCTICGDAGCPGADEARWFARPGDYPPCVEH